VERKSREDPIFDERKVENNAIDYRYRLLINISILGRKLYSLLNGLVKKREENAFSITYSACLQRH